MDVTKFRRSFSIVASAALVTALTLGASAAPMAASPDEQKVAERQARAEARAEAKAARAAVKQARAVARAEAKAARAEARLAAKEKVTACHKPGTPAEGTIEISGSALQAHLDHGDVEGECEDAASAISTDTDDPDGSGDDDVVSIVAPESVGSQELLQLEGGVDGLDPEDLSYVWSSTCLTDEQLTDPAIVVGEPDAAVLVIREGALSPGATCEFTLTVIDEAGETIGSAMVTVEVLSLA